MVLPVEAQHGNARFWTTFLENRSAGFAGVRLHREISGANSVAAEIVFWDADGQFYVKTFDGDIPLAIMEALISEAKDTIKTS